MFFLHSAYNSKPQIYISEVRFHKFTQKSDNKGEKS